VLHRGRRRDDGTPVLLKTPRGTLQRGTPRGLLEREYEMLRGCSVPGVVRARELVRGGGSSVLVLEDAGAAPLDGLLRSGRLPLHAFFRLGTRLCTIVAELHRQDITHACINPRSILVQSADHEPSLHDFSLATRGQDQAAVPISHLLLGGALAYASPEQTGRMNRVVDYRTDLYSLGVTFYQALTGVLPFVSDDPLELTHWHLARMPTPPAEIDPTIPVVLSRIVLKLLSKTAEERYQSALGLREDLARCEGEWTARSAVAEFPLGQRDVSDRFLVSQKLYGREREVDALLGAFDRCCAGTTALTVVSGYAGIGKTALIQELYKPIVRQRGYFTSGKFDQIARMPYGGFIQAFRGLIRQLLTKGEHELAGWRARLSEALGSGSSVLAQVIPEVELMLGAQPPPPSIGPAEAQNRFRLAIQNFLRVLAQREHPLVVFLDDLQWADSASLDLLKPLLRSSEVQHFLLIGAYRDNEVDSGHPLARTLAALETEGVQLFRVALGPLALTDLTLLIHDTLHGELSAIEPLARLILEKTGGNPFFVIQFLKALREGGLLNFDYDRARWTFQMDAIARAGLTDNVIDLMTGKIQRLSARAQVALTLGACIGNQFDLHTFAIVNDQSDDDAAGHIREALEAGLIIPVAHPVEAEPEEWASAAAPRISPSYAFLHDRVQQAAYSLIPDDRKQLVHLTVGRLLLDRSDAAITEEKLFDIVHHLNLGRALIADQTERIALARLNLTAGRKAKSATAYDAALGYFTTGFTLLTEARWDTDYDLAFELHLESAECEYLCGRFDEAEQAYRPLLQRARTRLDRARIHNLRILQYEHVSRYADAIRAGGEGLALFGVVVPEAAEDKDKALAEELAAIQAQMGDRSIEALIDLPTMEDLEIQTVMKLRANLHTSCFLSGDKVLTLLNTSAMVRLSLVHGNIEESAYAYALHAAMLVGPVLEDHQSAYEFGLLALRLNERLHAPALRSKILMMFAWQISVWCRPLEASFPYTRDAFRIGKETGLFVDAAWALFNEAWLALLTCCQLDDLHAYAANVEYIRRIKMDHIADGHQVILQWGRALQGLTYDPVSLTDAVFDEAVYRREYESRRLFEMFHVVATLALRYTFGDFGGARDAARLAEDVIRRDFTGTIWDELRVFYHALTLAALHAPSTPREVEAELDALSARLARWAESAPHLFRLHHLIVAAELARARGRAEEAMVLYETAIGAAAGAGCPRERALANELYAVYRRDRGHSRVAAAWMLEARDAYAQWGAAAKVRDLERRYPDLLTPPATPAGETAQSTVRPLDLVSVMKAARAITVELELEGLLQTLMRIALENAGAERGYLLLDRRGDLVIEAEGAVDPPRVSVVQSLPFDENRHLSQAVVHYVRKTAESVVLGNATTDERFAGDPHIAATRPRSILCAPIVHQGKVRGMLYLENNLTADAFTADRIETLHILLAEAAISLENARLYGEMRQEVARRRQAEEDLRTALGEVESLKNRLHAENVYLQEEIRREHNFTEMVGSSPALLAVLRKVEQVARTDSTVLIHGETGTGKELIARAIHNRGARKDRPLVKVNCSAISAGLVESELFGHVKGAFTGAIERRVGRFELANGGTIFLDEVGELPVETQVKLLRVLQEHEFEPVGSNRTVPVDVRVIAATNRDLPEAVQAGRFRADLFYRLNVFPIVMPPLRERRGDIAQLVMFFLAHFAKKFGKKLDTVSRESMERLVSYAWPGNIRELQNIIERSVVLSQGSSLDLDPALLPAALSGEARGSKEGSASGAPSREETSTGPLTAPAALPTLEEVERGHILAALERTGWVIEGPRGAARILQLHPNTLRSRMHKLGIRRGSDGAP
jgi:Nif-specific regulatory protein